MRRSKVQGETERGEVERGKARRSEAAVRPVICSDCFGIYMDGKHRGKEAVLMIPAVYLSKTGPSQDY